jgi:hypothetical protein
MLKPRPNKNRETVGALSPIAARAQLGASASNAMSQHIPVPQIAALPH